MKNKKINLIMLFIALSLVFYFVLKDDFNGVISALSKINIWIFLFGILVFILSLFFKAISLWIFIREYKRDYSVKKSFILTLIGQFLNGITPFQSGGQPFQIYMLRGDGLRISDSTNAMIKDFISFQIALIIIGIASIFLNHYFDIISMKTYLKWLVSLGFLINSLVLIFLVVISATKKSLSKITSKIVNLIFKFKISNKIGLTKERIEKGLVNFYESGKQLKKDKKNLFISVFINMLNLILLYIIPFIVFKSLGEESVTILSSVVITAFVMIIGNFIPIPGATGGVEFGFVKLFCTFLITTPILSSAVILWRCITYFLGMLIGFVTLIIKKGVDLKCE